MRKNRAVKAFSFSVLTGLLTFSFLASTGSVWAASGALSRQPDLINWIVGPAKADLGESAQVEVPQGFRFATASEAAIMLRQRGNPAPETLAGLMTPVGGGYFVIFEYAPVGYVKASSRDEIDPEAVLIALRENFNRQGTAGSVSWHLKPQYDESQHSLEWAILAEGGSRKTVNHVLRILGREGVLDGIAVQPVESGVQVPLKQLMAGVSFKPGYTYADYRKGDRVAKHSLADLITSENANVASTFPYVPVIAGAGAAIILGIGGFLIVRRKSRMISAAIQTQGSARALPKVNGVSSLIAQSKSAIMEVNGHRSHANGKVNGHGKHHRKRMFDYQRYYSDLMFQVSDRAYEPASAPSPRRNDPPADQAAGTKSSGAMEGISAAANASLIEGQKRLIEEQQRLIREQSKLIEEKSRVIQEKNQVIDKQSELFGNSVF